MLGIGEECIYLTEGCEAASCRGADEGQLGAIAVDHGFWGRKTMAVADEVQMEDKLDDQIEPVSSEAGE